VKFDTTDWPTDQPPAYPGPTIAGGRAGGLDDPTHPHARPQWSANAGYVGAGSRSGLTYSAGEA